MKRIYRTAFSLCCGTICALLMALWVRSFWNWESGFVVVRSTAIGIESTSGVLVPYFWQDRWATREKRVWNYRTFPRPYDRNHLPFSWQNGGGGGWYLYLPHWFVAHIFAMLAFVPWVKWSRRFGSRTLFVVTTYLAVLSGLIILSRR